MLSVIGKNTIWAFAAVVTILPGVIFGQTVPPSAAFPTGAMVVESRVLPESAQANRALVLWMEHPEKHPRFEENFKPTPDMYTYSCPRKPVTDGTLSTIPDLSCLCHLRLQLQHLDAGDLFEVTEVLGQNSIALLDGSRGDQQIVKRQDVSFRRLLAFDLSDQVSGLKRDGMERNQVDQFLDVLAAALARLRRPGPVDAMHQFGHRDR